MIPKHEQQKKKKLYFVKIKNFCAQRIVKKMKKQPQNRRKYF